ncbi:DUF6266 family protein [Pedobacter frigoris]|uniref:DUF6266 family protein n=1 Tax=Pedobacter frigoris TaxID=2571272 RepID=UPI0029317318|nr:DUF6266 family protein [Pedobacter frigoris]
MGKLNSGLFGAYTGKIGNLSFYQINEQNIVRTIGKNTVPPSEAQLNTRQQMAVATIFVQSVLGFIKVGFKVVATNEKRYPFNMAVSYHKKYALIGTYPNVEIDYSKVILSQGDLLPAQQPLVSLVPEGLLFSWFTDPIHPEQSDLDQVMLMAYFPASKQPIYILAGAIRSAGSEILKIPLEMQTGFVETYISFITEDRTAVADSVYTGRVYL